MGAIAKSLDYFLLRCKLGFFSMIAKLANRGDSPDNVILFESNSDFSDNPRALFDYMVSQGLDRKYKLVWIVKDMSVVEPFVDKYPNVLFMPLKKTGFSAGYLRMIHYFSIAKYAFYSHKLIGIPGKKGQVRFFLTHAAMGLKDTRNLYWDVTRNTDVLCTSEFAAYYRCISFGGGLDRIRLLGFPRNDKFFEDGTETKRRLGLEGFSKLIIWMPTFKHNQKMSRKDFDSNDKRDISLLTDENLSVINEKLAQANIGLVIKFHPSQNMNYVSNVEKSHIRTIPNAKLIAMDLALYTLIGCCDAMVTDFSSVCFDYLMLDRPMGFELGDKEKYASGLGFLTENPLDFMTGSKIYTLDDFLKFVDDIRDGNDPFREARQELRRKVHNHFDANSSRRIVEYLGL